MDCCDHVRKELNKNDSTSNPEPQTPNGSYTCPMHPEIHRDRPGMCPECGMALVPEKKKAPAGEGAHAHDKHAGHKTQSFLAKFWFSLLLTLPVLVYSDLFREILGIRLPLFPGARFAPLILGSAVFWYGGWVFLASAWRELKAKLPGMMTLIALAIIAAYSYSLWTVLSGQGRDLFWELTTLITIMLLGHWIEMRSVQGAQSALKELSKLLPDKAEVIRDGNNLEIPLSELKAGDLVFVRPGGKIPADGVVEDGSSDVNESMVTGESKPVRKEKGQAVIAGTSNGDGSLKIRASQIGEGTFLAGVMRLVAEAQASKSRLQLLSDRAAFYLTFIAVFVGFAALAGWTAAAGFETGVQRLVAVLVIACPHALGLAVPLVASISTTLAARQGFLVKRRMALEAARNVDVVLFDKTGTLTTGEYGVTGILPNGPVPASDILRLAASVDAHSEHYVSKAIVSAARAGNISLSEPLEFARLPGLGVEGKVDGQTVRVGGENLLGKLRSELSSELLAAAAKAAARGETLIYVLRAGQVLGALALADIIRPESKEAIRSLKEMGVKSAMLTGDSEEVAKWVAAELGLDEYFAKVLPGEKAAKVKLLQAQGRKVAMTGDGVNDAPALTQADLGIAVGAGTNVAIESAGIILMRNDPRDIPRIIRLSRLTYRKMVQNLWWATGYNVLAIPLAAGVLAPWGILLPPALAAALMSVSTIIVSVNALFLRRASL